jgi:hypothetical protein
VPDGALNLLVPNQFGILLDLGLDFLVERGVSDLRLVCDTVDKLIDISPPLRGSKGLL